MPDSFIGAAPDYVVHVNRYEQLLLREPVENFLGHAHGRVLLSASKLGQMVLDTVMKLFHQATQVILPLELKD